MIGIGEYPVSIHCRDCSGRKYPFSSGDLRDSASVLYNYLEAPKTSGVERNVQSVQLISDYYSGSCWLRPDKGCWEVFMDEFDQCWYGKKQLPVTGTLLYYLYIFVRCVQGSTAVKIPWEDLRYIFGEIMYGGVLRKNSLLICLLTSSTPCAWHLAGSRGHIVDDWDRRMCEKYLSYFMQDGHGYGHATTCIWNAEYQLNDWMDSMEMRPDLRPTISRGVFKKKIFFDDRFRRLLSFFSFFSCHQDDILDEMELVPYVAHPQFSNVETLGESFEFLRPMDSAGSRQGLGPTRSTSSTSCLTDKTTRHTHFNKN